MERKYDDPIIRQQIMHHGLSVPGTAASTTVLLRYPLVAGNIRLNAARLRLSTGGTAAGPTLLIGKSLAGTGVVTNIGTHAFGTSADGSVVTVNLTRTDFDPGDEVVISNLAGTAASTPVINFSLGYKSL